MDRREIISYCLTFKNAYKDLPFRDQSQLVINHRENRKVFAWFYEVKGEEYVRFRCSKKSGEAWEQKGEQFHIGFFYEDVCWIEVALNGEKILTEEVVKELAEESYELTKPHKRRKSSSWYFT